MRKDKELFEKAYEKPGAVWTSEEPPEELKELVESEKIKPCKVLDIGCGEGFYAIYLAKKGFKVSGIDLSENAIKYAKQNAEKAGVKINFKAMDLKELPKIKEKFDFILEWAILHSVKFEEREKHVKNVNNLLNENGIYISVCFNIKDSKVGGKGRIRLTNEKSRGPAGMTLYFSTLEELKELFGKYFKIIESKAYEKPGKVGINAWNYFLMEKK